MFCKKQWTKHFVNSSLKLAVYRTSQKVEIQQLKECKNLFRKVKVLTAPSR